jgi:SOS response regulatory protein OraA/RecX
VKDDERADALDTLERVGYVDDARYAAARASALAGRGFGDEAVRRLLETDGSPADAIEAAVAALDPETERAERLALKLGRTARVSAQLQRKGFSFDALEAVFGEAFADTDDAA